MIFPESRVIVIGLSNLAKKPAYEVAKLAASVLFGAGRPAESEAPPAAKPGKDKQ